MGNDNHTKVKVSTTADNSGLQSTQRELGKLDDAAKSSSRLSDELGGALQRAGVAAGIAAGAAAGAAVVLGFRFNSSVEQATAKINAFTKDNAKTGEILEYVKKEAAKTQFSFTDMAEAAAGLIPTSKMTGVALQDLIKEAEILAALNPAEGLVGAAFSLKEALSGDFVSIVERFNLPRKRLNELKEQGVPAMEAVRTALREMGIDYELVAKQGETTAAKWNQVTDQFDMALGKLFSPVFEWLGDRLSDLQKWIEEHQGDIDNFTKSIGEDMRAAIEYITKVFKDWLDWMKPTFEYIGDNQETLDTLSEGLRIAGKMLLALVLIIMTVAVGAFAALIIIVKATQAVFDGAAKLIEGAGKWIEGAMNGIKDTAWEMLKGIVRVSAQIYGFLTAPFEAAYYFIVRMIGRIASAIGSLSPGNVARSIENRLGIDIPGFATGVRDFGGGWAVVGENGPELARLPSGTDIYSNGETRQMLQTNGTRGSDPASASVTNNIYGDNHFHTTEAVREYFVQLNENQTYANRGLTTRSIA